MIFRHDDFDFRLGTEDYINIHEQFIKAGLTETAVLQFTQWGHLVDIREDLIKYMNETPNWDFQVHGWGHFAYDEMEYDFCVRDLAACKYYVQKLFHKEPTIWFPPWNGMSISMEKAAAKVGMKIDNESNDIAKFIREIEVELNRNGNWGGHSVYFHGWNHHEMELFPKMLELAKRYETR